MMNELVYKKTLLEKYQEVMPTGAGALFIIQIFATLGFSVLYSTLILYATKGLHMDDSTATSITGAFVALNYFLHLLGGYMGGRYFSYRQLFSMSMLLQVTGCWLIAIPQQAYLLWGLSAFLAGSGLNVTCINCMVTQLFEPDDKRRETAFLWNYSGMNIGFFAGFSIGGYFHLHGAYQELFLLSGLGNLIALAVTLYHWKILKDRDTDYEKAPLITRQQRHIVGLSLIIALFFCLRILLQHTYFSNHLIMVISAMMLGVMLYFAAKQETQSARNKILAYIILAIASVTFWTLYQLAPMGLNLFIERNVNRHVLGTVIAPQWVQNINTLVIIIGGPLLSVLFTRLRERGMNINIPLQFSLALMMIGVAFAILPIGIRLADPQGMVNFAWVFASYLLQSSGELFISPIGYAMVGELAPVELRGLMMGTWMMTTGLAAILSDYFSKMALGAADSLSPLLTNQNYSDTFGLLGWSAIATGVVLLISVPIISKLAHEKSVAA